MSNKWFIIIRGLRGTGKSLLAEELKEHFIGSTVIDPDTFFYNAKTNIFKFKRESKIESDNWCYFNVAKAMHDNDCIIMPNTLNGESGFRRYLKLAEKFKYRVFVINLTVKRFKVDEKRNSFNLGLSNTLLPEYGFDMNDSEVLLDLIKDLPFFQTSKHI